MTLSSSSGVRTPLWSSSWMRRGYAVFGVSTLQKPSNNLATNSSGLVASITNYWRLGLQNMATRNDVASNGYFWRPEISGSKLILAFVTMSPMLRKMFFLGKLKKKTFLVVWVLEIIFSGKTFLEAWVSKIKFPNKSVLATVLLFLFIF